MKDRRKSHAEAQSRYRRSPKGRAQQSAWRSTPKGKQVNDESNARRVLIANRYYGKAETPEQVQAVREVVLPKMEAFKDSKKKEREIFEETLDNELSD